MSARHRPQLTVSLVMLLAVACTGTPVATPASPQPTDAPESPTPTSSPTPSPSPGPTASPAPTPEPEARTFTSDDGLLTIEVPPGVLPDDVELTATAQGQDDLPPELAGIDIRSSFYRLEPDGMAFAEPITITRRAVIADLGFELDEGVIPIITLALRTSDGSWSWLDDQEISVDGDQLVLSGKASHTSTLMGFGGTTFARRDISEPNAMVPVGGTFSVLGALEYRGTDGAQPMFGERLEPYSEGSAAVIADSIGDHGLTFQQNFRCQQSGTSWVGVAVDIEGLAAGQFFGQLGLPPTQTELYVGIDLNCFTAARSPAADLTIGSVCVRVVHQAQGAFISYLEWFLAVIAVADKNPAYFVLTVEDANDGAPYQLRYDVQKGGYSGELGLHGVGTKRISRLVAHMTDGTTVDLTDALIDYMGGREIDVRFPQEDEFGRCEDS